MAKYSASFNIILSVSYEFEADGEDEAKSIVESIEAQDVFINTPDGMCWQWDEVDSESINLSVN